MLGLRLLNRGILPTEYKIINLCQKLEKDGFLKKHEDRYILTRKGLFLGNSVFEQFL